MSEPYVFVGSEAPDGSVSLDGPHDIDRDLRTTFAILRAICPETVRYWRIVMEPDRYGTHWPRFTDITREVKEGNHGPLPGGNFVANLVRSQKGHAPLEGDGD